VKKKSSTSGGGRGKRKRGVFVSNAEGQRRGKGEGGETKKKSHRCVVKEKKRGGELDSRVMGTCEKGLIRGATWRGKKETEKIPKRKFLPRKKKRGTSRGITGKECKTFTKKWEVQQALTEGMTVCGGGGYATLKEGKNHSTEKGGPRGEKKERGGNQIWFEKGPKRGRGGRDIKEKKMTK